MPNASNPGPRSTPAESRATSHDPISTGSVSAIRAVTKAWVRFGSQVVQVFSPVSRHVPASASLRDRAGDRAAGRGSAALLGRRVVDQGAGGHDLREQPIAKARRDRVTVDQRPDDVELHREAECRRAVDGGDRAGAPLRHRPSGRRDHRPRQGPPVDGGRSPRSLARRAGSKASPRSIASSRRSASARTSALVVARSDVVMCPSAAVSAA